MHHIVNPKYRWLNSLLVATLLLVVFAQFTIALLGAGVRFHLLMAVMHAYLAYFIYRVTPWAYLAVAFVNFVGLIFILESLATLGLYGFVEMALAIATIWCAVILRSNLLTAVKREDAETQDEASKESP